MKDLRIHLCLILATGLFSCTPNVTRDATVTADYFQEKLDDQVEKAIAYLPQVELDSMAIPRSLTRDGALNGTDSRSWTSGFYPGVLWMLYAHSGDDRLKEAANSWTTFIDKEKYDTHTHDLGFKVYCSFGHAFRLTGDQRYKETILQASNTLIKRYNPRVGCIRSWDFNADIWQFPVIIDNMMNLEMLFEATRLTGDSMYYDIAYNHAQTTLRNHVRADRSTYHVIDYDTLTGEVRNQYTHQGFSAESAWSRGQAWSLYGFATAYRETGDERFLTYAKEVASFIYEHPNMPEHGVPYWDYDASNIPNEPLDASAAAVAASGMLILCEVDPSNAETMMPWIDRTLETLSSDEFASQVPPFLVEHSVGSIPGDFEVDVPLIYADYYFIEALTKRISMNNHSVDSLLTEQ